MAKVKVNFYTDARYHRIFTSHTHLFFRMSKKSGNIQKLYYFDQFQDVFSWFIQTRILRKIRDQPNSDFFLDYSYYKNLRYPKGQPGDTNMAAGV